MAAPSSPACVEELVVGDPPGAWGDIGFDVDVDAGSRTRIGTVAVRLVGRQAGRGVVRWTVRGLDVDGGSLDGLATDRATDRSTGDGPVTPAPVHPNGTSGIDHLVVATPDLARTVSALERAGLPSRRVRDTEAAGAPLRQTFFRLGEVILEVVGSPERAGDGPARFYGLALSVDDLDALADRLGPRLGRIKPAVQPGRRIATLRHREAGLSTAIAFMDHG